MMGKMFQAEGITWEQPWDIIFQQRLFGMSRTKCIGSGKQQAKEFEPFVDNMQS